MLRILLRMRRAAAGWPVYGPATVRDYEHSQSETALIGHRLGLGLALVGDVELDGAHRPVCHVLVAVDRAARNIDIIARLEHTRRLALDGEGDFAFLYRPPLIAGM